MAVTSEQPAPYAPSSVMLLLLHRNREKGLPNPITPDVLQRLGVSDSLVPRTMQALKTLDLVGEDGKHTGTLETLRRAPESEYRPHMAEWLKAAYEHALDVIDPATADEVQIRDAFRHYTPISVQPRMVTLFTTLFEAAGVRPAGEAKPSKKAPGNSPAPRLVPKVSRPATRVHPGPPPIQTQQTGGVPGLHPAVAGLLGSLPSPEVGWTKEDRDRFLMAFGVVLDFAYPPGVRRFNISAEAEDAAA